MRILIVGENKEGYQFSIPDVEEKLQGTEIGDMLYREKLDSACRFVIRVLLSRMPLGQYSVDKEENGTRKHVCKANLLLDRVVDAFDEEGNRIRARVPAVDMLGQRFRNVDECDMANYNSWEEKWRA